MYGSGSIFDMEQKQMVCDSLVIRYLIINTCISYDDIFHISLRKGINIALLQGSHMFNSLAHGKFNQSSDQ